MAAMSCASDIAGGASPWSPADAGAGGDGGVTGLPCLEDLCLAAPSRGLVNAVVQATMSSSRRMCATAAASVAYSSAFTNRWAQSKAGPVEQLGFTELVGLVHGPNN